MLHAYLQVLMNPAAMEFLHQPCVASVALIARQYEHDVAIVCALLGLGAMAMILLAYHVLRKHGLSNCLFNYLADTPGRRWAPTDRPIHLLLCIADHFEPHNGRVSDEVADKRVARWQTDYPAQFQAFRDSDGRPPQHTFFYPIEQYDPRHVETIASLCRAGFGEFEIHLHHENDTSENLRNTLLEAKELLASQHGLLARHRATGELAYAFIHGNWALDNSHPDGRHCGVNDELKILRDTGCYADFTLPCPGPTQPHCVNRLYYATDDPHAPRSHDTGLAVGRGSPPPDSLLLIPGPLMLNWNRRKWGLLPRVENGCLQRGQPPTMQRLDLWLRAGIQVPARPDWFFVKLYCHGANGSGQHIFFDGDMANFHRDLARRARNNRNFQFHYVTAREMYNLLRAAESGWKGSVNEARDFELVPVARSSCAPVPASALPS